MTEYAHPNYLYFLLLIPAIVLFFIIARRMKHKSLRRFGNLSVISRLMPEVSKSRPVVKFILVCLALTAIIFAIAGPRSGSKLKEVKRKGVEIMIALDVSNSMLAQDIKPSRLEKAKMAISKMVDKLRNDKIGLIVFAGDAYMQVPITTDYSATKMFLETINTDVVPKQGTAIGSAIDLAMNSFDPQSEKNKALIIITDGENHEGNAVEFAKEAFRKKGIFVHTIGIGSPEGKPIPIQGRAEFKRNEQGQIIMSKLDETTLKQIAAAGRGSYIRAGNITAALDALFDEINQMEKQEFETEIYAEYEPQFEIPVAIALILLFIDLLILERKNRVLKNIRLFK